VSPALGAPRRLFVLLAALVVVGAALLLAWDPDLAAEVVAEDGPIEWLQVALFTLAGVLAFRASRGATDDAVLHVFLVVMFAILIGGELDLDRRFLGGKLGTRLFVSPHLSLVYRGLLALALVALAGWLATWAWPRRARILRAGLQLRRRAWGQILIASGLCLVVAEVFERPLNRLRYPPPTYVEEVLELIAAIGFAIALLARTDADPPSPGAEGDGERATSRRRR
jgi:hypothetical protein